MSLNNISDLIVQTPSTKVAHTIRGTNGSLSGGKNGDSILTTNQKNIENENRNTTSGGPSAPFTLLSPYLMKNPGICSASPGLDYVIVVHSAVKHRENRKNIRDTWANTTLLPTGRVVFLLGKSSDVWDMQQLAKENLLHADIVQGDFIDTYHNLTLKGAMGLRWVSEHCPDVRVVLKVDDDIIFNTFMFIEEHLHQFKTQSLVIKGNVFPNSQIRREPKSQWYVPKNEPVFKGKRIYPKYVPGIWVALSTRLVKEMYKQAFSTPFFWVDDVYMFGLLTRKVGNVVFQNVASYMSPNAQRTLKCYQNVQSKCTIMISKCDMKNYDIFKNTWNLMKTKSMNKMFGKQMLMNQNNTNPQVF